MPQITILDSIMGSGKTTYVLRMLNEFHEHDTSRVFTEEDYQPRRYLVVVPYLTEVDRYKRGCPDLAFSEPKQLEGRKLKGLLDLVTKGENIVTTHSLFLGLDAGIAQAIFRQGYNLIVDETPQVINLADDVSSDDIVILKDQDILSVDESTGRMKWNVKASAYKGRFSELKEDCEAGYLVESGSKKVWFYVFPSDFFRCFNDVVICTYLFRGSVFAAYCQSEGLKVRLTTLDKDGGPVDFAEGTHEEDLKANLRPKLMLYSGSRNDIGRKEGRENPLSAGWFSRAKPSQLKQLKSATEGFFDRVAKTGSKQSGWTTYKAYESEVKGKGYAKGFIAANARATNDYAEKAAMAFLCNWFEHPSIVQYFRNKGVEIDEDQIALSVLVQWIWRSRIRNGESVHLFIPSERMRARLAGWLLSKPNPQAESSDEIKIDREAA